MGEGGGVIQCEGPSLGEAGGTGERWGGFNSSGASSKTSLTSKSSGLEGSSNETKLESVVESGGW